MSKLIYLSHTRLDIAFIVSMVCQFMNNPKEVRLQAVHRILRYRKSMSGRGNMFNKGMGLTLEAYTDVDCAGLVVDRRATSGYCTLWKSSNLEE